MTTQPKNLLISIELAQAVATYLSTRPYREVFEILDGLKMLREASEAKHDGADPTQQEH